jgi:hypothetical protein
MKDLVRTDFAAVLKALEAAAEAELAGQDPVPALRQALAELVSVLLGALL